MDPARSAGQIRESVASALRQRRADIEDAVLARARWISDPSEIADPAYAEGLRKAVAAAVEYGIAAVASGEHDAPPVPSMLLEQARFAALSSVSLDTVLRRYVAGFNLFGDHVLRAAEAEVPDGAALRSFLQAQASQFDRLLEAIAAEHARAREARLRTPRRRLAERVGRLLAGEPPEAVELDYELDGWHLSAIAAGARATEALRAMATVGAEVLQVASDGDAAWLWFRAEERAGLPCPQKLLSHPPPPGTSISLGEPARGLSGWRLTHRQAAAALSIADPDRRAVVYYGEVSLLVTALQDDLLASSLRQAYLEPLCADRNNGAVLLDTLRAYFRAERNVSSAAALLGVNRQTISNRIRAIEQRIGRSLPSCAMETELALRIHDLRDTESGSAGEGAESRFVEISP